MMRVRIARDMLRRLRELTQTVNQLEREITALVEQVAPQLLTEPGFGPPIAAKLVGEIAGARRFATPAKLARVAGVAPIPASSPTRSATSSTTAPTARSTPRCTASSSLARAATSRHATSRTPSLHQFLDWKRQWRHVLRSSAGTSMVFGGRPSTTATSMLLPSRGPSSSSAVIVGPISPTAFAVCSGG
jgi:Transposase IS116/IS110/IS902 family